MALEVPTLAATAAALAPAATPDPAGTPALIPAIAPSGQASPAVVIVEPSASPSNVVKLPDALPPPQVDFTASLKPENKLSIDKAGFKSADALVESYNALRVELQNKAVGELPADATPEQKEAWNKARGRPDKAGDYALTMPNDVPKDLPYDGAFADNFKSWAYDAGLTKAQADFLHGKYVNTLASSYQQNGQAATTQINSAMAELKTAWGDPQSDGYNKNVEMATRAMRHLDPGLSEALKKASLLGQDGTVLSAPIAKALAKAGVSLFAEDSLFGSANSVANNPWTKGRENLTEQGKIANSNPERARTLAKAAGINPKF